MVLLAGFESLGTNALQNTASTGIENAVSLVLGNPLFLVIGIILIIAAIAALFFLKKIIVHCLLGVIAWAIVVFVFHINLPLLPSLVVSAIFGLAGIGVMLILAFLGIV